MSENKSIDASRHDEPVAGEWLLPSVALNRFEPPADMVFAAVAEKEIGRYGFKVGSLGFLIQTGIGSEVIQAPTIWSLPGSPPWCLGLINLRGSLVPVFELNQVLGFETGSGQGKPLVLVFDQGDKAVGILIDDFPRPLSGLDMLPHMPQLPTALNGHVSRGYVKDGMIWFEFDHNSFFAGLTHDMDQHNG